MRDSTVAVRIKRAFNTKPLCLPKTPDKRELHSTSIEKYVHTYMLKNVFDDLDFSMRAAQN